MNDRKSVLIVLFDVPMNPGTQRREYTRFLKGLRKLGFMLFQKSVYVCLLSNSAASAGMIQHIKQCLPQEGSVQLLSLKLTVFRSLLPLRGTAFNIGLFSDDMIVI